MSMRNKLALIIALASFGVVTALGVGFAGAEELSTTSGEAATPLTTPAVPTAPVTTTPACTNEVDDDGDGLVDMEDPNCESPEDTTEEAQPAASPTNNSSVEAPAASAPPTPA